MERDADIARPVLGPVLFAVRDLGLDVHDPRILGAGANVVVHLRPAPVVARVATLTAEMRSHPLRYLQGERDISAALVDQALSVIGPTDRVDPGPHLAEGVAFLLLDYKSLEPLDIGSSQDAIDAGRAFAELSEALAGLPDELSGGEAGQPWAEIERLVDTASTTTEPAAMHEIRQAVHSLRAAEPSDEWQLVHGDAHRVNVARHEGRIIWFDFEDANRRPLAWDLATLRRAWPAAGETACEALGVDSSAASMRWHHELREVYALLWNLLYAQRYERAREPTAKRLSDWLSADPHMD